MFIKISEKEWVNLNNCRLVLIHGSEDNWNIGLHYENEKHKLSGFKSEDEAREVLDEIWNAYREGNHLWEPDPNKILNVKVNGKWLSGDVAIETFINALYEMDIEKVKGLEWTVNSIPLVSTEKHPYRAQRKVDKYYIVSGHNTISKKKILDKIADKLGIEMLVTVNPRK